MISSAWPNYSEMGLEILDETIWLAVGRIDGPRTLGNTRSVARRRSICVERVAGPTSPDHPLEPRRLRSVLSVLLGA